jgi:hypothetical protein
MQETFMNESTKKQTATYILGGVLGLCIGLAASYLFLKNQESAEENQALSSRDGLKIGLGLVSFLKQIADLGHK